MEDISAFFEACESGKIIDAKDLLRKLNLSSLVKRKTREGRTCFHVAVIIGDPDLLVELAVKLRDVGLKNIITKMDENGDTALHLAVRKDRRDLVEKLVELDANLCDCANKEGETPLKLAVNLGFKEAVEYLVTRTANGLHYIVQLSPGLMNIIKKTDENGETALHLAVRKDRRELVKALVDLDANFCDCANKGGETPLKLAVSLGFKEAVGILIARTSNALHYIVELNQVKLVEYLTELSEEKKLLSKLINQPYHPATNGPDKENCATNPSDKEGNPATRDEGDEHHKKKSPTNESGDGGDKPSQSVTKNKHKAEEKKSTNSTDTDTQDDQPIFRRGDTPLHVAARNKYEHMVNLLLKVGGVNLLARNSEDKTPFEIAREVTDYHESFRIIRKLAYHREKPKPFMYCAPQVSHKKYKKARIIVNKAYEERRNAELVVAALLAAMTCAAAFTVPGGFDSESKDKEVKGSPVLIYFISLKLFIIFDCIAFFLSLFVCIMWEMSSELTTGDKMLFMTVNSLVVCWSFGFTAYGFMCAVYAMLASKVKTFAWVVLGSLIFITLCGVLAFIEQSVQFAVTRARFHRLCGVACFFDDIVEKVWSVAECCGLLNIVRLAEQVFGDLITGHGKFSWRRNGDEDSHNNSHCLPSCCSNHV